MKIAVVTESSTANRNTEVLKALDGCGHEIYNLGMKGEKREPELLIVDTGFLSALLLNLGCVDFVIGGCGTGQGYVNCVLQYPDIVCGLIREPLDAWLFPQINGGNCISLALNQGFGWAGDINLEFIFERMFSISPGGGYPEHRKIPQQNIRKRLQKVSGSTHLTFDNIIAVIDDETFNNVTEFPGVLEYIFQNADHDSYGLKALKKRIGTA